MKTKNQQEKPKRGTIGYEVEKLVKRYGGYTMGLTILELALEKACSTENHQWRMMIDGKHGLTESPRYKELFAEEQAIFARICTENKIEFKQQVN